VISIDKLLIFLIQRPQRELILKALVEHYKVGFDENNDETKNNFVSRISQVELSIDSFRERRI
jgi:hypothetical protein